uniref:Metallophosphoesterase n=1 Tax=Fervidicoccus fontis TaxID=683846 RepID=A0A7J3ZJF6_9CREN
MEYYGLKIVPGYPAAYHKSKRTLMVADLHLGFETEAQKEGIYLPRLQLKRALELIEKLSALLDVYVLIVNGDLKQSFEKLTLQEREEVARFLAEAKDRIPRVVLVRGNHDNYVSIITSRFDVPIVEKYELSSDILLVHGHKIESKDLSYKLLVIGHEHPAFKLFDELGSIAKLPCFLHVPLVNGNSCFVLPAAGYYQTGNPITLNRMEYLSPVLRDYSIIEEAVPIVFEHEKETIEFPPLKALDALLQTSVEQ